jgi:hypothetical protein
MTRSYDVAAKFTELCIDCASPRSLAEFWSQVLAYEITDDDDDDAVEIKSPGGYGPTLLFIQVPEPKAVKNRLHIDVNPVGSDQDAEVQRILELGARRVDIGQGEQTWVVLADPEGNEFCVLNSRVD